MKRWHWLGAGAAIIALAAALEIALRCTTVPAALEHRSSASTEFVDREGRSLRILLADERRYATNCALAEISPHLIAATISAEDQRFWQHRGIDGRATLRALAMAVRDRRPTSGASTITQQLIKLADPGPRTLSRKVREMWLAMALERRWPKERIIEEYLNRVDYGNLQFGIASASRSYLGKPPGDLSVAEAAFLAGLPKAPSLLNPHGDFPAAHRRQLWVLDRLRDDGILEAAAHRRAVAEAVLLQPRARDFAAPHFVDLLLHRQRVVPLTGGRVRTTLDLPLTQHVEKALAEQLERIADKNVSSGAVVVIENQTGDVLALAGSGDYFRAGLGQVNGAWMVRSPGSAVKPFTYLLALERGANPGTVVADVRTDFATPTGLYRPNNYNHRFHGPVSLRFSLGNSLNVGAIRALELAGGPEALHRCLRDAGLTTLGHPAEYYGLGITLGNAEVRLLELTNAFATLARLGRHQPFRLLLDDSAPSKVQIFNPRAAYLVADMLADNTARAASFGLNSYLHFDFPVACKTGTSSDYRDNWALGYTPEFTVGVWIGNPDGAPMRAITGVTGAAPVLHAVFSHLHDQRGTSWFTPPQGISEHTIHPLTGRSVPANRAGAVTEQCLWPPEAERKEDYDDDGRVILGSAYTSWLVGPQNSLGNLVVAAESTAEEFRVVRPLPGTVYFLDPDLPRASQRIVTIAAGAPHVEWSSDSLPCATSGDQNRVVLREGRHTISARDPATGRTAATWIEVRAL